MHTVPKSKTVGSKKSKGETPRERMERLYSAPGGPLLGWLRDEAAKRGHDVREMARYLGVTHSYVEQLAAGIRPMNSIQQEFADACSRYLNVPSIVCKLLSGNIRMSDFLHREQSEVETIDRAIREIQSDPQLCEALPNDLLLLPFDAKRAIALMYAEVTSNDVLNVKELPETVHWLQRAALNIDEASAKVGD